MIELVYVDSCPLCGGSVSALRLLSGLPCEKHGDTPLKLYDVDWLFKPFGVKPWSAQRLWARRFLRGESFILTAPTGSGKTLAGMAFALAAASMGKRALIMVPTATLAYQVESRLREASGEEAVALVGLHSLSKKPSREELEKAKIIVSTSMSLIKNRQLLSNVSADLVFVDDVDGFLRRSKAIDVVLSMLGVSSEQLKEVEEALRFKKGGKGQNPQVKLRPGGWLKDKQVIVSGATQTAKRTKRVRLLSFLLGFDVGSRVLGVRNVLDAYAPMLEKPYEQVVSLVKRLGPGGLIYVQGAQKAVELAEEMLRSGIKAHAYVKASKKAFNAFLSGEVEVLVGTATPRSSLVRGIDIPEAARYAVFVGVPKYVVRLSWEDITPARALVAVNHVARFLKGDEKIKCGRLADGLRRIMVMAEPSLERVKRGQVKGEEFLEYARQVLQEALSFLREVLKKPEVHENSSLTENGLIFPDAVTYVQASGRTSRLTVGGMTQGLSILLVDDDKAFKLLREHVEPLDISFKPLSDVNLEKVLEEVDRTRALKVGVNVEVKSLLVVVESPTKARTIATFFGKPVRRMVSGVSTFEVISPMGIMVVVATKGHFYGLDIDKEDYGAKLINGTLKAYFKPVRPEVVEVLRKLAQDVDEVLVATDPDAEGEKIAWDVKIAVSPFNPNVKRVKYHEVTRKAVVNAVANPEEFSENLLRAQLLRRLEDAWIGLPLSAMVQKAFHMKRLSAGRVQTPVLGWVIERTELNSREKVELIDLTLDNGFQLTFRAPKGTYVKLSSQGYVEVVEATREVKRVMPPPPYTTSSLLVDAGRELKMSSEEVMRLAQELFESGLITYHRTDSTMVSALGMQLAKQYLSKVKLEEYSDPKPWSFEVGAHECIRPTKPLDPGEVEVMVRSRLLPAFIPIGRRHLALYEFIFQRFMASQMKPVSLEYLNVKIKAGDHTVELSIPTRVVEQGFNLIKQVRVAKVALDKGLYRVVKSWYKLVGAEPLYTEADLVRLMKEKGIGRPSTYAIIVGKLKERYYVAKLKGGRLASTKLGREVYEYLTSRYEGLVSEERTKLLQDDMDAIERGELEFTDAVKKLHEEVLSVLYLSKG